MRIAWICSSRRAGAMIACSCGLEEAFNAAMASKRGVTLYVNGQTIGGAITKIEAGKYVELKN